MIVLFCFVLFLFCFVLFCLCIEFPITIRIMKGDILAAVSPSQVPATSAATTTAVPTTVAAPTQSTGAPKLTSPRAQQRNFDEIPNSNIRKVIAKRLSQSKRTVPHAYSTQECQVDNLLAIRKEFQGKPSFFFYFFFLLLLRESVGPSAPAHVSFCSQTGWKRTICK